jgi:ectoine hydroxylase-related dioxygenase (phytanoyl-CoA dioxygenase family)
MFIKSKGGISMPYLLTAAQIKQYHEEGFLLVKGLYSREQLNEVEHWMSGLAARKEQYPNIDFIMEKVSAEEMKKLPPLGAIRKINGLSVLPESLKLFGPDSPAAKGCSDLLGADRLKLIYLSTFAKPANHGSETPWHQDQSLWNWWGPTALSCWIAFDECTKENGYLQFLKGSHKEGMANVYKANLEQQPVSISKESVDPSRVVALPMEPGDAVFFGGFAWHYSEPNRSDKRRVGVPAVYASEQEINQAIWLSQWIEMRQGNDISFTIDKAGADWFHERATFTVIDDAN